MDIDDITEALRGFRLRFGTEAILQSDVWEALRASNIGASPEFRLCAADRVDFFVDGARIGIECKVDGGLPAVTQQLLRYAAHDAVDGLILVTRRNTHCALPATLNEKPLRVVYVGGSSL